MLSTALSCAFGIVALVILALFVLSARRLKAMETLITGPSEFKDGLDRISAYTLANPALEDQMKSSEGAISSCRVAIEVSATEIQKTVAAHQEILQSCGELQNRITGEESKIAQLTRTQAEINHALNSLLARTGEFDHLVSRLETISSQIHGEMRKINVRSVSDQITMYPRKIRVLVANHPRIDLEQTSHHPGGLEAVFRAVLPHNAVHFKLRCESLVCKNRNKEFQYEHYDSETVYRVTHDMVIKVHQVRNHEEFNKVVEILEIFEVMKPLEERAREILTSHPVHIISLTFNFGAATHPAIAIGLKLVGGGLTAVVHKVINQIRDREAGELLLQSIEDVEFYIKDVSGPGHMQFAEAVRHQEQAQNKYLKMCYGGLSRWMNLETGSFEWLCPTDAYDALAKTQEFISTISVRRSI